MSGQCLSSDVAGRALTPATRQSLGEPLPHQQADRTWAARTPVGLAVPTFDRRKMPIRDVIRYYRHFRKGPLRARRYPGAEGTLPMHYSPVRH